MSDESGSDEGFEPSPVARKRRRLNDSVDTGSRPTRRNKTSRSHSIDSEDQESGEEWSSYGTKKAKSRVHIPQQQTVYEETFVSQVAREPGSSPYRLRGPVWIKPKKSAAEEAVFTSISKPTARQHTPTQHDPTARVRHDHHEAAPPRPTSNVQVAYRNGENQGSRQNFDEHPTHEIPQSAHRAQSSTAYDVAKDLEDLPSDAFASSSPSPANSPKIQPKHVIEISSQVSAQASRQPATSVTQKNLRQMTLFGAEAKQPSIVPARPPSPPPRRNEPPTQHKLDLEAAKTWVYPTNLGAIRDYQYNIVQKGLFHNLLVALPTGLGKTFIAATIMLNWYRWTKDAQILFVAPTKPLVSQQVDACFKIVGIPRSQTSMLTGGLTPAVREQEWLNKRVFFMTPQTLTNDLSRGICNPKRIVLLVVDEAHRATGNYAYVKVVSLLRRFNPSFRVLALTATPGGSIEAVQEVINGLDISQIEIRTELSLDIINYVFQRKTDIEVFDENEEMQLIMGFFSKAVGPVMDKLSQFNAFWSKDPMSITAYGMTQARQRWNASNVSKAQPAVSGMLNRIFAVLASLGHYIDLLKYHGIGPFYHGMQNFMNNLDAKKNCKYEKEIVDSESFKKMMTRLQFWMSDPNFIGHPKLEYLQEVILKHFTDADEEARRSGQTTPSSTRVMIFAQYRDSAEEIVRVLRQHDPILRPHVFVGQATSKTSEGMDQKTQQAIISRFKGGEFNTLVATSIGEEGLDIGEVDLIICYDSSSSPIRMLQRMGRTGRKRAGHIVLLLMKGKEHNSFLAAKDGYEKMQKIIASGSRFEFHHDRSPRILPLEIKPDVDKRHVDIPVENQVAVPEEPVPKGRGKGAKKPAKKFHMPDGVETGFVTAATLQGGKRRKRAPKVVDELEHIEEPPALEDVELTKSQHLELLKYRNAHNIHGGDTVISLPDLKAFPDLQRSARPIWRVRHGRLTTRIVQMLNRMHDIDSDTIDMYTQLAHTVDVKQLPGAHRVVDSASASATRENSEDEDADKEPHQRPATASKRGRVSAGPSVSKPKPKSKAGVKAAPSRKASKKQTTRQPSPIEAREALPSSPPATDPRMRLASQGIHLGSADTEGEDEEDEAPDSSMRRFIASDSEDDLRDPKALESDEAGGSSDSSLPDLASLLPKKTKPKGAAAAATGKSTAASASPATKAQETKSTQNRISVVLSSSSQESAADDADGDLDITSEGSADDFPALVQQTRITDPEFRYRRRDSPPETSAAEVAKGAKRTAGATLEKAGRQVLREKTNRSVAPRAAEVLKAEGKRKRKVVLDSSE